MEEKVIIKWLKNPKQAKVSVGNFSLCLCTFYNNGKANIMMIDSVQTKEEFRKKGHGTKLIKKAIKLAKEQKVDSIELVVNKNNKIAKKLYEQAGFEKTDKDYYRLILNKWTT